MKEIRESIVRGITKIPGIAPDESAVERILLKIRMRKPANKADYAYIAGLNWARDELRRREAAPRVTQRRLVKQVAELERKLAVIEEEKVKARCLDEFERVSNRILPTLDAMQAKWLAVVRMQVFETWEPKTVWEFFGITKDCSHQWKRRGVKLLWPHLSEDFRKFLGVNAP